MHAYTNRKSFALLNLHSSLFEITCVILIINELVKCAEKDTNTIYKAKRKVSRAPNLSDFEFELVKKINRKEYSIDILESRPMEMCECEAYKSFFNILQGLARHRFYCKVTKAVAAIQEEEIKIKNNSIRNFPNITMEKRLKSACINHIL